MSTGKIVGDHRYLIGALIATGTFSSVHRCVDLATDNVYAVKIISKSMIESQNMGGAVVREVSAMEAVPPSPYLVRLVDKLVSSRNYYLVMNVVEGCTLLDVIKTRYRPKPPLRWVRCIFRQLLNGLHTLHGSNVVHRDIKPENLLLNRSCTRLVISDFGFACCAPPGRLLHHSCGTINYCAPELLVPKPAYDGRKVDVWAAGVTLYVMLFGVCPFQAPKGGSPESLIGVITSGVYTLPHSLQPELEHLLAVMLHPDPALRWSVRKLLRHVWVLGGAVSGTTDRAPWKPSQSSPGPTGGSHKTATMKDYIVRSPFARALRADDTNPSVTRFHSCPLLRQEVNNFLDGCGSDDDDLGWDGGLGESDIIQEGYTKFSSLSASLADIEDHRYLGLDGFSDSTGFTSNGSYNSSLSVDNLLQDPDETPDTPKGDFILTVRVIVNFLLFCTTLLVAAALRLLFDVPVKDLPLPSFVISAMEHLLVPPHERPAQSFEVRRLRHRFPCAALRKMIASAERAIQRSGWCRRMMPGRRDAEGRNRREGVSHRGPLWYWFGGNK